MIETLLKKKRTCTFNRFQVILTFQERKVQTKRQYLAYKFILKHQKSNILVFKTFNFNV